MQKHSYRRAERTSQEKRHPLTDPAMLRVPSKLLEYKQWILWRLAEVGGRLTKVPISHWNGKVASCTKPRTWSTFRHVCYARQQNRCDGIGFVFSRMDPFCGIDLDHCRSVDGTIATDALDLIRHFDSYTEVPPSGSGIHILIKGKRSGSGRRSGNVEMYDSDRYFTVTGNHLSSTPFAVHDRQQVLDYVSSQLFAPAMRRQIETFRAAEQSSDDELIEIACKARNGRRFRRLWVGDTSDYGNDHSRADLALCCDLMFWCGGDSARVDRLFRRCGLMRDKWDRRTGDSFYGALTLKAARTWSLGLHQSNDDEGMSSSCHSLPRLSVGNAQLSSAARTYVRHPA